MTLCASLEGVFGDVAAAPVSTLLIPADAALGVYNLTFTIASAGGYQSGTSAIRVARWHGARDGGRRRRRDG